MACDKDTKEGMVGCGIVLLFLAGIQCVIFGAINLSYGYDDVYHPYLPRGCSRLSASVTKVSRLPSLSSTGNAVVHFEYNATVYDMQVTEECTVPLHNTWPDSHAERHYPVKSLPKDVFLCDQLTYTSCQTAESLRYSAVVGFWLLLVGSLILTAFCVIGGVACCEKLPEPPPPPQNRPAPPPLPPAVELLPIAQNNEKRDEENAAVAVAVSESNHAHPYALASVV
jgi:hypothetical protein